ncbi:MAG: asparagine synthase (glutamine-hydrolyzing) [Magnetococcales bacterium]|nr:asparagine synthase (glutamine-hydrolyzing) [Magnetococcales bacterium]
MCGIAGYLGLKTLDSNRMDRCVSLMDRRGPDHRAHCTRTLSSGHTLHLLHSRLSILDLDPRSNQPFTEGGDVLIFNGELYNYKEIRTDLEQAGESFRTTSDTEVLLRLLRIHGEEALDRCEGMWAFAWYNAREEILTLSRDRFGEKPLYTFQTEDGLYFGSEIKFLAALSGKQFTINSDQIKRYLVYGSRVLHGHGETFFRDVEAFPSASIQRLSAQGRGDAAPRTYWSPAFRPDDAMAFDEAVSGIRSRMIQAVDIRLRADVPLAFCMSGGVDSSTLISIAKRIHGFDVHGFTFNTGDARYDEQAVIEQSVQELGIKHTLVSSNTTDFLPRLQELIRYHDAPIATITWFANWMLMESIKGSGYTISLSGVGADELFSGYYDHHPAYLHDMYADPEQHAKSLNAWKRVVRPVVRNPHLQNPDLFVQNPGFRDHLFLTSEETLCHLCSPWDNPFSEQNYTDQSLLRNRMLNEAFMENVPVYMHEEDLNAMYYSIENRSPFLDRTLFEFAYTIPTRHLIKGGKAKAVLREAMRGIAPDHVLDHTTKTGFNAPIQAFLAVHNPSVRAYLLADSPIFEYIRHDVIERLTQKEVLPNSESKFLFSFLNSKLFLEMFC